MLSEQFMCEHKLYHCPTCEVKLLKRVIEEYMQENEQLKQGLKSIENKLAYLTDDKKAKLIVMEMIDKLFDQIQGKDDER